MKHDVGVDEWTEADGEVPLPIFRRGSNSGDPRDTEGSIVLLTNKRMKLLDPTTTTAAMKVPPPMLQRGVRRIGDGDDGVPLHELKRGRAVEASGWR